VKTRIIIHELHNLLNMLKGFTAGYKSSNSKEMLIEKEGQVYKITIEEIGRGAVEDFIDNTI
jgi:hypothetical protein